MQNRYAGDVGDFIKLALLRALSPGRKLGMALYLYPDEHHNGDGKHVRYLDEAHRWQHLDPELFDKLAKLVERERSVEALERADLLQGRYFAVPVPDARTPAGLRSNARYRWFTELQNAMFDRDLVFADPDNGLVDDSLERRRKATFGKQLPLSEARALSSGRSAIIYHHNTRFRGGHDVEVEHWLRELGNAIAVRANAYSCRTFFIINPDVDLVSRAEEFCKCWKDRGVWLHTTNRQAVPRAA